MTEKPERACLFIDGGNFYHLALKKLGIDIDEFDFAKFSDFLMGKRVVCEEGKRYYTGTVREREGDLKSKEAMSKQTRLFGRLKNDSWQLKTSKLRRRIEELVIDRRTIDHEKLWAKGIQKIEYERWREKGIDVKLATDLIVGALDNKYDTAIVVSSDSDLIPAIDWVRNRTKKKVEYVGFSIADKKDASKSTKPLLSMIPKTDIQKTIVEEELRLFLIPTQESLY